MAKLKFCTSGGVCITCDGLFNNDLKEAADTIEKAQERGDRSFLCCNDGTGIKSCIRVSDISVITEVPSEVPPGKDEKDYENQQDYS